MILSLFSIGLGLSLSLSPLFVHSFGIVEEAAATGACVCVLDRALSLSLARDASR